jgi:hydrogenase nickel incorporation protein HypB
VDLVPYLDITLEAIHSALARVMPQPAAYALSARTGEGLDAWFGWLSRQVDESVRRRTAGPPHHHSHEHSHD